MRIAFDAKRAFQNSTGLGHYSRTLITSLVTGYPQHQYYLMAPKLTGRYQLPSGNAHIITPRGFDKAFSSLWRSKWVKKDLKRLGIDLYHGLSHEIPVGIHRTGIRSVVTMHDLIFEHYPNQYKAIDVAIYRKKFRYACRHADHIIAISQQTKKDLVDIYHTPPNKITVCYQSCDHIYGQKLTEAQKDEIRKTYGLPQQYLLYVGSIIERKNLLRICQALAMLHTTDIPLVVIGSGSDKYYQSVKEYIRHNKLEQRVIFLSEQPATKDLPGYKTSADFPAIYQSATALIYPSMFEGFGIPVLEALWSGLPVITSNTSCLPEAGGNAAYYIDPHNTEDIAMGIEKVLSDNTLREQMIEKGYAHAATFSLQATTAAVMQVYQQVVPGTTAE